MDHIVEKLKKQIVQTMLFFFFSLCTPLLAFASTTIPSGVLSGTTTWTAAESPYIVSYVQIPPDASLIIEPGTIVKIAPSGAFDIYGALTIGDEGSTTEVIITSLFDDTIGGDTNGDATSTTPHAGDWFGINVLYTSPHAHIHHTTFRYGSGPFFRYGMLNNLGATLSISDSTLMDAQYYAFYQTGGTSTISNTTFARAPIGIYHEDGVSTITGSSFTDLPQFGIWNVAPTPIEAVNNWWGHASGPYHSVLNPSGEGTHINGDIRFVPWLTKVPGERCVVGTVGCYSNILFLPGFEASRMYRPARTGEPGSETQLWEPTDDALVRDLFLDANGKQPTPWLNTSQIYTKGVIDEAYLTEAGPNIYKSFLTDLDSWKNAEHLIADYSAVSYDWRFAPQDILRGGNKIGNNISYIGTSTNPYIKSELARLAANSKTGKVTIIAHSNGGLVAKMLLKQLEDEHDPLLEKVDVLILVASPQVGTPQAMGGLLYGYKQGIPKSLPGPIQMLSDATAREFGENLPGAYTLLPSAAYFGVVHDVNHPLVSFDQSAFFARERLFYGNLIGNSTELYNFLLGAEGRDKPAPNVLTRANVLNPSIVPIAMETHADIDGWTPPPGITLHQIAGWGEETLAGIKYQSFSVPGGTTDIHTPDLVLDGDGTVVVPSALYVSTSTENVRRWWVNLDDYNSPLFNVHLPGIFSVNHANILEVLSLRGLIQNIITNSTSTTPLDFISTTQLVPDSEDSHLNYFLHSPLTLTAHDDFGNEVSAATSTIPGARYREFGEVKYLSIPADVPHHLVLNGYATGSFTLEIQEVQGDTITATTTFVAVPTATSTRVTMDFMDGTIENAGSLNVDEDGNGTTDFSLLPKVGEVVTLPTPKIPLTATPDSKTITLGSSMPTLLTATLSGFQNGDTATSSITGAPTCTTTATNTSLVGIYPIVCTIGTLASSQYDFTVFATGTLTILYRFDGFLQPINDTTYNPTQSMSVFKGGSTIPVKFQLKNVNGTPVQSTTSPLWLTPQKGSAMSMLVGESTYSDPATSGTTFKWDATAQQYIYNWSTKGVMPGYWYRISAKLNDGTTQSVVVGLR